VAAAPHPQFMSSPLAEVIRRAPISCAPQTCIRDVLETMARERIGSMMIAADRVPLGIFTVQDVLTRVVLGGACLEAPVATVMSRGLATLPLRASAYDAAVLMAARGIHHVVVLDDGRLAGVVSERDLFGRLASSPRDVGNAIRNAVSAAQLQRAAAEIQRLAHDMVQQGLGAAQVTQMLSALNDLLTRRIIEVEALSGDAGDIRFCWIAMGSEGREEQTFGSDQDNGIIFELPEGASADAVRRRLLPLAARINTRLAACGFALCRGNIMASNPECCLSLGEWQRRFAEWMDSGDPPSLLKATIFFDFRPLYGALELGTALRDWLKDPAAGNSRFLHQMAQNALANQPPLGLIRDFVFAGNSAAPHTLDLKVNGVTPFVDAARIFALMAGVSETGTVRRLRHAGAAMKMKPPQVDACVEAFQFIQQLRLRQQDRQAAGAPSGDASAGAAFTDAASRGDVPRGDASAGGPAPVAHGSGNLVDPDTLNELDRRILKESMRQARKLQQRMARALGVPGFGV